MSFVYPVYPSRAGLLFAFEPRYSFIAVFSDLLWPTQLPIAHPSQIPDWVIRVKIFHLYDDAVEGIEVVGCLE